MAPRRVTRAQSGYHPAEAGAKGRQGPMPQKDAQLEGRCEFGLPDMSLDKGDVRWGTGLATQGWDGAEARCCVLGPCRYPNTWIHVAWLRGTV